MSSRSIESPVLVSVQSINKACFQRLLDVEWAAGKRPGFGHGNANKAVMQIKNAVLVAQAMADDAKSPLQRSHLEEAIEFNNQFQLDFRGAGQIENMHSYS